MKKTILLFAVVVYAASMMAQTIGGATINFHYCFTDEAVVNKTVWDAQLPFTWQVPNTDPTGASYEFTTQDFTDNTAYKEVIGQNEDGCERTYKVTVTKQAKPTRPATGAVWGKFAIGNGANDSVYFSQGNLQYCIKTNEIRFADNQYDFVGGTCNNVAYGNVYATIGGVNTKCDNANIITTNYEGWIDLFGWNTANSNLGLNYYSDNNDRTYWQNSPVSGHYVDWGTLEISNGDNVGNSTKWFTLTNDQWSNLFSKNRWGYATIVDENEVLVCKGIIVVPQNYVDPQGFITTKLFKTGRANGYNQNVYNLAEWELMEYSGALFLPAAGSRKSYTISELSNDPTGNYWSSSVGPYNNDAMSWLMRCNSDPSGERRTFYYGNSVRLVQAAPAPSN